MNRSIYLLISISILFFGCLQEPTSNNALTEELPAIELTASEIVESNQKIKTGKILKQVISQNIVCSGKIEIPPTDLISIHSKIPGQVTAINYLPGDYVKNGALLLTIQNLQLIEKQRILLETKANLAFAKKDFERKKILKSGDATTQKNYDESESKVTLLSATYKGLKEELSRYGINVNHLENEQSYQSDVNIYASGSGYIHEVLINKGQMINPEIKLMEIANNNHMHLELQVLSKDIAWIKKGQNVQFSISNHPKSFSAKVVKMNPMINEKNTTLQVHCHIENKDKSMLIPGLFTNAIIEAGTKEIQGLPLNAVVKEGEDYFAFKLENDAFQKTQLKNTTLFEEFIVFDGAKNGTWIIEGAYYIE